MSALSRFGPSFARSVWFQQHRQLAAASSVSDPIQKLFVDKIREFKASNKGLDEAHEKAMSEEMARLKRVYKIQDESKLAQLEHKFSSEHDISLRDLDDNKEMRKKIASGEYQKELAAKHAEPSVLLASIPEKTEADGFFLPSTNKPDAKLFYEMLGVPRPVTVGEVVPDIEVESKKVTPGSLEKELLVSFGPQMPTINDDKAPERDLVNYPRIPQPLDTPPTRLHVFPESWFQFFYPKTGVTGPYVFAGSFITFLLSKEWLIVEHELLTGITTTMLFVYAVFKFGPKISGYLRNSIQKEADEWEQWRLGNAELMTTLKNHYSNELKKVNSIDELYAIREQDIQLQLEGEYRNRLQTIYEDTKRRLNYLVSVADSKRQIAHNNMVNWVISNAVSSISQKQESEVLDNCIMNLRELAKKNTNVI